MKAAYLGSNCEHCTETSWVRALYALGHEVVLHVDQRVAKADPLGTIDGMLNRGAEVVFYSRTHNDSALGPEWTDHWRALEARGVKTCSLHLDLFWGIPEREEWIANGDPLFTTGLVCTPDPGDRPYTTTIGNVATTINLWDTAFVDHLWTPPAIDRIYAYRGTPREEYRTRFLFVGSEGYHEEYGFRPQLIQACRERWGDDFRLIGGNRSVRGHELADVYASADVVVGDWMFALDPERRITSYISDRVPEVAGRGGLLVGPYYQPGIDSLVVAEADGTIDGLLDECERVAAWSEHCPEKAEERRRDAHLATLASHLYEHRMERVLGALGVQ